MTMPDDDTGAALQRLIDDGSDLGRPMDMDFFVAVPTEAAGQSVAVHAQALGFETSVERDQQTGSWTCYCSKNIVPSYSTVAAIERQLDALGQQVGGHADGFGSFGNADE